MVRRKLIGIWILYRKKAARTRVFLLILNGNSGMIDNMKLGVFFLHRVTGGGGAGTILRKWTLPYKQRLSSVHSSPASCSPEHYLV